MGCFKNRHSSKKGCRMFKSLDLFGHPVRLNFDKKGSSHQTFCGTLVTILFVIVSLAVLAAFTVIEGSNSTIDASKGLISKTVVAQEPLSATRQSWLVFFATDPERRLVKVDNQ